VAGSLSSQQEALLAEQKQLDLQMETFQTKQQEESEKTKAAETSHDAVLAIIEGMKGQ
jgi:hypothetical protein